MFSAPVEITVRAANARQEELIEAQSLGKTQVPWEYNRERAGKLEAIIAANRDQPLTFHLRRAFAVAAAGDYDQTPGKRAEAVNELETLERECSGMWRERIQMDLLHIARFHPEFASTVGRRVVRELACENPTLWLDDDFSDQAIDVLFHGGSTAMRGCWHWRSIILGATPATQDEVEMRERRGAW